MTVPLLFPERGTEYCVEKTARSALEGEQGEQRAHATQVTATMAALSGLC